jgi:hypothetical protein
MQNLKKMKNIILTISLLFCITAFSQEQYVYKGNGRVFDSKGIKVSPIQMRNLLSENIKALELYNEGMTSGKGLSYTPIIIGGAMIIIAIPVKIGFSKKIKKAVDLMNNPEPKSIGFIESSSILINQNGIGFAVKF